MDKKIETVVRKNNWHGYDPVKGMCKDCNKFNKKEVK